MRDEWETWNVFDETPWRRIFVGDVHLPLIFGLDADPRPRYAIYDAQQDSLRFRVVG